MACNGFEKCAPNNMFTVPITLNDTQNNVEAIMFGIEWNPQQATYISMGNGTGTGAGVITGNVNRASEGKIEVVIDTDLDKTLNGNILNLQFDGDPGTVFKIDNWLAPVNMNDAETRPIDFTIQGTTIISKGVVAAYQNYNPSDYNPGGYVPPTSASTTPLNPSTPNPQVTQQPLPQPLGISQPATAPQTLTDTLTNLQSSGILKYAIIGILAYLVVKE